MITLSLLLLTFANGHFFPRMMQANQTCASVLAPLIATRVFIVFFRLNRDLQTGGGRGLALPLNLGGSIFLACGAVVSSLVYLATFLLVMRHRGEFGVMSDTIDDPSYSYSCTAVGALRDYFRVVMDDVSTIQLLMGYSNDGGKQHAASVRLFNLSRLDNGLNNKQE